MYGKSLYYLFEIAKVAGTLETLEGFITYNVNDVIITGIAGEKWVMSVVILMIVMK